MKKLIQFEKRALCCFILQYSTTPLLQNSLQSLPAKSLRFDLTLRTTFPGQNMPPHPKGGER